MSVRFMSARFMSARYMSARFMSERIISARFYRALNERTVCINATFSMDFQTLCKREFYMVESAKTARVVAN